MSDTKAPHPSELLEFGTASPVVTHYEHIKPKGNIQNGSGSDTNPYEVKPSDTDSGRALSSSGLSLPEIGQGALAAAQSEHRLTFRKGLRLYPKAIFWSAVISSAIVMEGYDTALINSFYAFPEFQRSYGVPTKDGRYQITTKWQTSLNNGAVAGSILGLLANGLLTERFGYRRTMQGAMIALAGFIFLSFFAFDIETLLAGQILCGLPWGVFSTLTVTYAAEVMPLTFRGYLTSNVNQCWLFGQITALGTLRGFLGVKSEWSYRIPFGLQWVWIFLIFVATCFAPESPWHLVRNGRTEEAKKVLLRLTSKGADFNADNTIAMMQHTDLVEKKLNRRRGTLNDLSYFACFQGSNLRRTEIACCTFVAQNLCGLPVIGFAAYFYNQIGFDEKRSFDLTMGMHGLAILGSFLSLVLMKFFGRRTMYLTGLSLCFLILLAGGIVGSLPETPRTLWALAALIILFIFVFDMTMGPITYCLVAEIPSTRLRVKTVVLARISYNLCAMITNIISNHMLNPLAWNWRAKSCFFWAGTCFLCIAYCYWRLPETKGLTYHELDILFEKGADARKFASIQRTLEETGYFELYNHRVDSTSWAPT